ncbi:MAG: MFS transporter [Gammaproteobacteria bacterium]|jgi:PAT family beta-lactamase induction signal transducer AmpG|nr:MFS transporter [Gammaproteobacteria bacterium]|tara:strand:+ start:13714 stop:14991 length:1278 start_codon:yes stop_codon:yes gene_type:complete
MKDFFNKEAWINIFSHLKNKKLLTMFLLGFSAGLPLLLVFTTLSAWLRDENIVRSTIGFFGWVTIFYGLKFLWAPLIDSIKLPLIHNVLGKRRSWLLLTQLLICLFLYLLATISPTGDSLVAFAICALFVSFFSASQDIVVDAYRIEIAPIELQGILTAGYQFGYRVAILVSGAGALYIADSYTWEISYKIMSSLMLIGIITTLMSSEPDEHRLKVDNSSNLIAAVFWAPIRDFFSRYKNAILILIFIGVYRLSDLSMAVMANPFYLDIGFTLSEIATVTKVFGIAMTLIGAFIGGIIILRYGVSKPLFYGSIMIASTTLMFVVQSIFGNDMNLFILTIALDNFTGGFAGTVFIAYLSSLTDPKYTATQYALFSSLMLVPGKFLSGFSGLVVDSFGYLELFLISASLGIPAIIISYYLNNKNIKA